MAAEPTGPASTCLGQSRTRGAEARPPTGEVPMAHARAEGGQRDRQEHIPQPGSLWCHADEVQRRRAVERDGAKGCSRPQALQDTRRDSPRVAGSWPMHRRHAGARCTVAPHGQQGVSPFQATERGGGRVRHSQPFLCPKCGIRIVECTAGGDVARENSSRAALISRGAWRDSLGRMFLRLASMPLGLMPSMRPWGRGALDGIHPDCEPHGCRCRKAQQVYGLAACRTVNLGYDCTAISCRYAATNPRSLSSRELAHLSFVGRCGPVTSAPWMNRHADLVCGCAREGPRLLVPDLQVSCRKARQGPHGPRWTAEDVQSMWT